MTKVSVLISNYNYARYLPIAIDSVLDQTYGNIEIIVVDDGSTDESRSVIEQYQARSPEKIIAIFQANQGQGAAFNAAFAAATGDIIAFLDADDRWYPSKVQRLIDTFEQTPDIVGILHPLNLIDGNDEIISTEKNGWIPDGALDRIILNTGHAWNYPPTSGLTYRRSALEKVFPIDAIKWRLCADGCLVYCTAFVGNVIGLDEILASYRIHGANNHANSAAKPEQDIEKEYRSLSGVEMTNQYLNEFLEQIHSRDRVDLARNLSYRRSRYYLDRTWNFAETIGISRLILQWHFYNWRDRVKFLIRFWIKSAGFLIHSRHA